MLKPSPNCPFIEIIAVSMRKRVRQEKEEGSANREVVSRRAEGRHYVRLGKAGVSDVRYRVVRCAKENNLHVAFSLSYCLPPRDDTASSRPQRRTASLQKSGTGIVIDVSQRIPKRLVASNAAWGPAWVMRPTSIRYEPWRNGSKRRWRHNQTQTRQKLVVEHIRAPASRNSRRHIRLEPRQGVCSFGVLLAIQRIREGVLQFPPRLPPLVQSRISHTGTLVFLGKLFARLEETISPFRRRPPLDLVLGGSREDREVSFDESLQDVLRGHAARGALLQVHIWGISGIPLSLIISLLTPGGEGVRYSSIESIDLRLGEGITLDVSNFFARYRFPKLRYPLLREGLKLPSWDQFVPHATHLVIPSLDIIEPSASPPTTSQLLSTLVSNPNLQQLVLTRSMIPEDDATLTFQVPLRHLRKLCLIGELRGVFRLLDRLSLPGILDSMSLAVFDSTIKDVL